MTECCTQVTFGFYKHKQLVADFKGGQISSDSGLLAVRQLAQQLAWLKEAAGILSDPRDPSRTEHTVLEMLQQRIFGLIGGYEDCNDHDRLREDPILKLVADRAPDADPLASQPTLSRFENWVSAREVARLNRLLVKQYIAVLKHRKPRQIILDVDPTDDPCHGHQQLALFNGFYHQYMYYPLLVYERASGLLLGVRLRSGNAHSAEGVLGLLGPIVRSLKGAFPRVRIIVRADAGFAVPQLYQFCERSGLGYLIGIAANSVFKDITQWAVLWVSERFDTDGRPHRWIGGFRHEAGGWRRERHILYKAEVNAEGTNRRFVVTNLAGLPAHLYPVYEDRGTAETFIDQFKNGLKADRLSCHRFVANAFRLLMYALTYNLMRVFGTLLGGTPLENASIETIRSRLLKIGARIEATTRRVWVHIASGFPLREVLALVVRRIEEHIGGDWGHDLCHSRAGPAFR
jgi:hypothetical protein